MCPHHTVMAVSEPEQFPPNQLVMLDVSESISVPPIVVRIYHAAAVYYADPRHFKEPTRDQLHKILAGDASGESSSLSTLDRARNAYPEWFPHWPIPRNPIVHPALGLALMSKLPGPAPPGGVQLELLAVDPATGERRRVEVKTDEAGRAYLGRIVTTLVAGGMGLCVIDAADGRLDGVIHWCALLMQHTHMLF